MTRYFSLLKEGQAELKEATPEAGKVYSTRAFPPGSSLEASNPELSQIFSLKVKNCKKQPDGRFLIEGKWVNLTREQRAWLLGDSAAPASQEAPPAADL